MRWTGYGLNPEGSDPWLVAIGKLIVNFGALEAQTYFWLGALRGAFPLPESDFKLFGARVDIILDLVKGNAAALAHRRDLEAAWSEARSLATFRNRIAHNPIAFGWSATEEKGPPDFLTVLDFKQAGSAPAKNPTIDLNDIQRKINEIAATTQKLHALYSSVWPTEEGAA